MNNLTQIEIAARAAVLAIACQGDPALAERVAAAQEAKTAQKNWATAKNNLERAQWALYEAQCAAKIKKSEFFQKVLEKVVINLGAEARGFERYVDYDIVVENLEEIYLAWKDLMHATRGSSSEVLWIPEGGSIETTSYEVTDEPRQFYTGASSAKCKVQNCDGLLKADYYITGNGGIKTNYTFYVREDVESVELEQMLMLAMKKPE